MRINKEKSGVYVVGAILALSALSVMSTAQAREFDIKRNHVKFDGKRYFVAESTTMKLGTYGEKRSPVTQQNYLFRHSEFPNVGPVDKSPEQQASIQSDTSLFHSGIFKLPLELVDLNINSNYYANLVKNKKCSFVRERIADNGILKTNLNRSRNAIDFLKMNNDSRIVNAVIRVSSCFIKNKTLHDLSVNGQVKVGAINMSLQGKDRIRGETKVNFRFGKDTVIGYSMLKFNWDKRQKRKRTRIVSFEDDWQSFN